MILLVIIGALTGVEVEVKAVCFTTLKTIWDSLLRKKFQRQCAAKPYKMATIFPDSVKFFTLCAPKEFNIPYRAIKRFCTFQTGPRGDEDQKKISVKKRFFTIPYKLSGGGHS